MKVILEMMKLREKEFIIIILVIDMNEITEIGKRKERELYIIMMVVERWVIIITIIQ